MNTGTVSTLRPGLIVALSTSLRGNVSYRTLTLEGEHITSEGAQLARWETERTITDPAEHEAGVRARSLARSKIQCACINSAFGLLCPEAKADGLDTAIVEANAIVDAFNATAKCTTLSFNLLRGRILPDDVEAIRAINSEMTSLMTNMARGIANADPAAVREAANKARAVGSMLTDDARIRVQEAIEVARKAAKTIKAAGEGAAVEIDRASIARIVEARTSFLDVGEAGELIFAEPVARPVDVEDEGFAPADPNTAAWDAEAQAFADEREDEALAQVVPVARTIDLD